MGTQLIWGLAGIVGAVASYRTGRLLLVDQRPTPPQWGQLDGRARLGAARALGQYGVRFIAVVVLGVFCVLLVLGALLSLVTGGS